MMADLRCNATMRTLLLLSWLVIGATDAFGQAPAPAPTQPPVGTAKPAAPRPAQPGRRVQPPAATRGGLAMTVTDPRGETLDGIHVRVTGPTDREGETNSSGQLNFPGLQPGVYRLHFSGDSVIAFEREITVRPGQIAAVDVTLNAAPPLPEPSSPAPAPQAEGPVIPAAAPAGPAGAPQTISVPEMLERKYVGSQPRRETILACSGSTRTTMIQLNMPLPERLYETADAAYYVIGGEGTVRIAGRDTKLATNGFVSVPRGTLHSFTRTGRRPLILFAVLSGEPCEQAK
jgi:hypothetical protein